MNPEFPQNERANMEAKLTALLLGELHADEIAALSKALEADPELAALYERLKVTIELVREMKPAVEEPAPLKLSAEKREKLLASFKTVAPDEFAKPRRVRDWLVPMAACAAVLVVLAALILPGLARSKSKAQRAYAGRYWGEPQLNQSESAPLVSAGEQKRLSTEHHADFLINEERVGGTPNKQTRPVPVAAPAAVITFAPAAKQENDLAIAPAETPAAPTTPTTIILPGAHDGDQGGTPGQTVAEANRIPIIYAGASDISEALKKLSAQQTNVVAMSMSWGVDAAKDANPATVTATNWMAGRTAALGADLYDTNTSYRMLSQAGGAQPEHGKWDWTIDTHNKVGGLTLADGGVEQVSAEGLRKAMAEATNSVTFPVDEYYDGAVPNALPGRGTEQMNYFFANSAGLGSNKAPVLGDVPALGRMYKSELSAARNEGLTTASTRVDLNGLRYLTNGGVTSRPLASDGFSGETNSAEAGYNSGVTGAGGSTVVNNGALSASAPAASDGLLTSGLRVPTRVGGVVPAETPNGEIALPQMTELADPNVKDDSGKEVIRGRGENRNSILTTRAGGALSGNSSGFGGGGGGGFGGGGGGFRGGGEVTQDSVLAPRSQQAIGGKQVELAAANVPGTNECQSAGNRRREVCGNEFE